MHMADALISPAVGGAMWAVAGGFTVYSARKLQEEMDDRKVPLMGVLGAFIFAAQMINFTIPATGSSGHLGGGMILAILLGPHAAFLTMASILTVQALFFADGGLLALGCNIFNLGLVPCFVAYPLIYKTLAGDQPSRGRVMAACMASAVVGLQLGALGVVMETWLSGVSELALSTFALLMQPIHLAIGVVEGFVTAAVVTFIWKTRPEVLQSVSDPGATKGLSMRGLVIGLLAVAVITGGVLSWFASTHPDGLEWAMLHTSGKEELQAPGDGVHEALGRLQERVAVLPDYGFKNSKGGEEPNTGEEDWPAVKTGTTVSGLVGGAVTMGLALLIGLALKKRGRKA